MDITCWAENDHQETLVFLLFQYLHVAAIGSPDIKVYSPCAVTGVPDRSPIKVRQSSESSTEASNSERPLLTNWTRYLQYMHAPYLGCGRLYRNYLLWLWLGFQISRAVENSLRQKRQKLSDSGSGTHTMIKGCQWHMQLSAHKCAADNFVSCWKSIA